MKMRKRVMALVLLMVMALSLTIPAAASAGERATPLSGTLSPGTVSLEIGPTQTTVAVGRSDVWVTFFVRLIPDQGAEVPAFSFTLKPDNGMTLAASLAGSHPYRLNDIPRGGTMEYTPATQYYGIGGITAPLTEETWVMDMPVKLSAGTSQGDYFLDVVTNSDVANENFTAGQAGGKQYDRTVIAYPVFVVSGVSVSGTVCDDGGTAMTNAALSLRQGGVEIATATSNATGAYEFTNISAGSYEVKATSADGEKKGSASVTVEAVNVTQNVTVYAYILGDVNGDNEITAQDMQRLYEHLNGSNPLERSELGDINQDGEVTAQDMQRLYEHLNGSNPL